MWAKLRPMQTPAPGTPTTPEKGSGMRSDRPQLAKALAALEDHAANGR
jgi:hypothetical protein